MSDECLQFVAPSHRDCLMAYSVFVYGDYFCVYKFLCMLDHGPNVPTAALSMAAYNASALAAFSS